MVLSFLVVIIIGGIISLVIGIRLEHKTIFSLAQAKVRHDLSSAWMVYHEKQNSIRDIVRLSSDRDYLRELLSGRQRDDALGRLDGIRIEFGLDILTLTDASGRVVLRTRNPGTTGDDQSGDPLVAKALRGEIVAGTQIVSQDELAREDRELAEKAYFQFVETPMAAERPEDHEENGMMLRAAAPVRDGDGNLIGVLYGGVLLSRNFDLVDQVKDIVFRGEKYKGEDIGTATIFQWDLRVSTNVLDDQGQRALGTRVSREVNEAVLQEGGHWVGRAFVVRAWYITAYEPIRDIGNRIVGMLYVGMLEKPYIDIRNTVMGTFTLLAGLCTVFLLLLLSFVATNVTKPLRVMVEATDRIAQGDLSHRLRIDLKDEIGHLAESFNRMTENLVLANENLTQWGKTLEKRVEERTKELRDAQDALVQAEKLASLGKIAAGVAHEINNPLTSILINASLMLERPALDDDSRENLTMIADETTRCAQIVRGLLEFARQTPSQVAKTDINELIDRTVQVFEKQASFRNIKVVKNLDRTLPPVELDKNKMQQVFSNMAMNAFEAMHQEGTLSITTRRDESGRMIEILFADTGVGIPKENLRKLFDPFFTTKSFGTGLGLSVSYGIIEQAGGTIRVESEVGRGSTFVITLPFGEGAEAAA